MKLFTGKFCHFDFNVLYLTYMNKKKIVLGGIVTVVVAITIFLAQGYMQTKKHCFENIIKLLVKDHCDKENVFSIPDEYGFPFPKPN